MHPYLDLGIQITAALQSLGKGLQPVMSFFSLLGMEDFFVLVLPAIYWCLDSFLGIQLAISLMFSTSLNNGLKMAFHSPRPYWYSGLIQPLSQETSFGFPSNHALIAINFWGILAAYFKKWWAWLVATAIIFLIGFSRIYLGVHFPQDVIGGWIIGGLVLWIILRSTNPLSGWIRKLGTGKQILLAASASLIVFLLPAIPYFWLTATHWTTTQAWASFATQAITPETAITASATLFGLLAGRIWLVRKNDYQVKGIWWKLVLRYLLGIVGILIIRYGLKFIFPEGENLAGWLFRFLRYTLIGFWVAGWAPWVFIKVKLADKKPHNLEQVSMA